MRGGIAFSSRPLPQGSDDHPEAKSSQIQKRRCYQRRSGAPNAWNRPTSTGTGGSDPLWLCWRGKPARDPLMRLRRIQGESIGKDNWPMTITNRDIAASACPLRLSCCICSVCSARTLYSAAISAVGVLSCPRTGVVWFALNEDRPLCAFAAIWTEQRPRRQVQTDSRSSPRLWFYPPSPSERLMPLAPRARRDMPSQLKDYYLVTSRRGEHPERWSWEIRRRSKPLGVKLEERGFTSEAAAISAGKTALNDFLSDLLRERNPLRVPNSVFRPKVGPRCLKTGSGALRVVCVRARCIAASHGRAVLSPEDGSGPRLWCNPDPDPDDHQRYEDHQRVDRQPQGYALCRLLVHRLVPLRRILQREERKWL